jgi:hypothetical protein
LRPDRAGPVTFGNSDARLHAGHLVFQEDPLL